MHKSKTITVGEKKITAKDLSPLQIDELLGLDGQERPGAKLGILMGSNLSLDAVSMSTGIQADELLGEFSFEELAEIWSAVAEVNDFLLGRMDLAIKSGLAMLEETTAKGSGGSSAK